MRRGAPTLLFLAVGLLVSLLLQPVIPNAYMLLMLFSVIASGWTGGRATGIGAGILASACVEHFFLEPAGSFRLAFAALSEMALFSIVAMATGYLSGETSSTREALHENLQQFRVLLDGVKDHAVFLLDEGGHVATWNSGAQRIEGYTAEEIIGIPNSVFYPAEDTAQGKPQELLAEAAEKGSVRSEGWRKRKDGSQFWAEVTITALYEDNGRVRGYAKTTRDVTERKKNDDALKAKEEELRVVVESAPDGVLMTDQHGLIIFVNARVEDMFGYRREELLGKKVEMLVPAKHRGSHVGKRVGYEQAPQVRPMGVGLELGGLRSDGSEFPVEISLSPVTSGKEKRIVASVRDITERQRTERELQNARVQESAQVMVRDLDGRILRWNPGMERVYGYGKEEAEGAISHELLRTEFPVPLGNIEAELLREGRWKGELVHRKRDGSKIVVTSGWVLHRDGAGKPWRVLESSTDVTALKEAEAQAKELNRVLAKQNADLLSAKAVIESQAQKIVMTAKMSALGEMAGGMAHEINNPMGIIHARASDLIETAMDTDAVPSPVVIQTMEKIRNTASRVTKIVMGLRKFARETKDDPAIATDIREILDETLPFCLERLKHNSVELRVSAVQEELRVECRPTEISQVILNLLNNAVDAVQPLGEKWVELTVRDRGKVVEISVTDSGRGIPENIRGKLGQPFFTTKTIGQGTGLGLSISRGIVEAHGGQLELDAGYEHTRFVVRLPKVAARETVAVGG